MEARKYRYQCSKSFVTFLPSAPEVYYDCPVSPHDPEYHLRPSVSVETWGSELSSSGCLLKQLQPARNTAIKYNTEK